MSRGVLAKGTPVVSLDTGMTLGEIDSVFLDCEARRLVAFTFLRGNGLFGRRGAHIVEIDDIHAIGPDAVTLDDARVVHDLVVMDGKVHTLVELDQLVKRAVMTDGGSRLGHIVGLDFHPHTFRLTGLRLDDDGPEGERVLLETDIVSIGAQWIVVAERRARATAPRASDARRFPMPLGRIGDDEELRQAG